MQHTKNLEVLQRDGRVELRFNGTPVLEGLAVFGRMEVGFTAVSGAGAQFLLTGKAAPEGFQLTGSGAMSLSGLELPSVVVTASDEGVAVRSDVVWGDEHQTLTLLQQDGAGALWRGEVDFEERLPCSVTPQVPLTVRLAVESDLESAIVRASGEAAGLTAEASAIAQPGDSLPVCVSVIRRQLLTALERQAGEQVESLEDSFMELEEEWESPLLDLEGAVSPPSPSPAASTQRSNGGVVRTGYLGPSSGYLSRPGGPPARGYLDAVRSARPGGYLVASQPARRTTGYLAGRGYLSQPPVGIETGSQIQSPPQSTSSIPPPSREATAFSILARKDILYALTAMLEGAR